MHRWLKWGKVHLFVQNVCLAKVGKAQTTSFLSTPSDFCSTNYLLIPWVAEFFLLWGKMGRAYLTGTGEVGKVEEMEEKEDGWETAGERRGRERGS